MTKPTPHNRPNTETIIGVSIGCLLPASVVATSETRPTLCGEIKSKPESKPESKPLESTPPKEELPTVVAPLSERLLPKDDQGMIGVPLSELPAHSNNLATVVTPLSELLPPELVASVLPAQCIARESSPRQPSTFGSLHWKTIGLVAATLALGLVARQVLREPKRHKPATAFGGQSDRASPLVSSLTSYPMSNPSSSIPVPVPEITPLPLAPSTPGHVLLGEGSCSLHIESKRGGSFTVDGQYLGESPLDVEGLWCGRPIQVRARRAGYRPWSRRIVPQEGRVSRLQVELRRK